MGPDEAGALVVFGATGDLANSPGRVRRLLQRPAPVPRS